MLALWMLVLPLVICQSLRLNMAIEILDLTMKKWAFPSSQTDSLPERTLIFVQAIWVKIIIRSDFSANPLRKSPANQVVRSPLVSYLVRVQ